MNTLQANQQKKKPQPKVLNDLEREDVDNPYKAIKNIGEATAKTIGNEVNNAVSDMWNQILGGDKYAAKPEAHAKPKIGGDLQPGQAVDLKKAQEKPIQSEAPMNYFREISEVGKNTIYKEQQAIRQDVQAIIYELQRLASTSKQLQKDVALAVGPNGAPASVGKYHANFFEWMLVVVRDARKKVESAGAWLQAVKSKKKGKINGMKKNMSQLMSGERSVSNQTN